MDDIQSRQILYTRQDLLKESTCLTFLNIGMFNYVVEQLATRSVFHNQHQGSWSFYYFVKLHHMRVLNYLEDMYFSTHTLDISIINQFRFLENLACDLNEGVTSLYHLPFHQLARVRQS